MANELSAKGTIEIDTSASQSGVNRLAQDIRGLDAAAKQLDKSLAGLSTSKGPAGIVNGLKAASPQLQTLNAGLSLSAQKTQELTTKTQNYAGLRYALYDVASTWGAISAATLGAAAAVEMVGVKYESAFSGVERTTDVTGAKLAQLRKDLVDMSTELPQTFGEITQAATLGGQIGVTSDAIEGFTDSVVKFSATTNASVESTATGFARIAQLTGVGQKAYENIGSAIYKVGVESVATETEILNVAQEIATAGNLAGFTTSEIIGLSGALASLGVQPYLARGSITRIFREIDTAVSAGGEKLQSFAGIAGQSASTFSNAWKTEPVVAFNDLLAGMDKTVQSGATMTQVLSQLGITGSNDTKVLSLLANNLSVVADTQEFANKAFADGTALNEGYAVVADDAASLLRELANTILAIADAASNLGILKVGIQALQGLANVIKTMVDNPVGAFFSSIVIGMAALIGAMAAGKAATALMQASLLGLVQVRTQLAASEYANVGTTRALVAELMKMSAVTTRAKVATDAFNASLAQNGAVAGRNVATLRATGAAALTAATGMNTAATAARALASATLIGAALGAALWAISEAANAVNTAMMSSGERAEKFFGDLSSLGDAIKADNLNDTGDAIRYVDVSVQSTETSLNAAATAMQEATGTAVALTDATKVVTEATDNYTIALNKNTVQGILQLIANNQELQKSYMNLRGPLQQAGFDFQAFATAVVAEEGGGVAYMQQLLDQVTASQAAIDKSAASTGAYTAEQEASYAALNQQRDALVQFIDMAKNSDSALAKMIDTETYLGDVLGSTADRTAEAADGLDAYGGAADEAAKRLQGLVNAAFGTFDAFSAQMSSLDALGQSMAKNGTSFDLLSSGGRANMDVLRQAINQALQSANGDMQAFANNLGVISQALAGFGVSVGSIPGLTQLTESLPTADMLALKVNADAAASALKGGFASGAQKAASATRELSKEVYTLADYARDLRSVMQRAFDIRFGPEEAADGVEEALQRLKDLKQAAKDALKDAVGDVDDSREAIKNYRLELDKLNAKMAGLKQARKVLQYGLRVAKEYGDTLREAAIREKLAENSAEQAETEQDRVETIRDLRIEHQKLKDAQKAVTKAQEDLKRSTQGNTESERKQREGVRDLIQEYLDQIAALADSGLSQKELQDKVDALKEKFKEQMAQLGYTTDEVEDYSDAFDDAVDIITKMPKNVTVKANMNPAQQAINEFIAKNTKNKGISKPLTGTVKMNIDDSAMKKFARGQKLLASIASATIRLNKSPNMNPNEAIALERAIADWTRLLNSGNYASGGFTGRGGKYEPAGVVHKGEYVVPQHMVNQSTGLPYADAFGKIAAGYAGGGYVRPAPSVKVPSVMMVELSPTDRALLAANGNVTLTVDGQVLAKSVNRANTVSAQRGSR